MNQSSIVTSELLIAASQSAASQSAASQSTAEPRKGRGRAKARRIAPYSWLGVGAIGLGVGAALAGAALTGGSGVAAADTSTDTHVSSPGSAREGGRSTASHPTAAVPGSKRTPGPAAGRSVAHAAGAQIGAARAASAIRSAHRVTSREKPSAPTVAASARGQAAAVGTPSASAATVWQPGQILRAVYGIFVSNGTSGSPNAGL